MKRSYRHIQQYEKEILKLKTQGFTRKQIGEKLGLTEEQIHSFTTRYNRKQRKLAAGIALQKKGRPCKSPQITETDKLAELKYILARKEVKYILARKEAKIRQLEMENELMRDFLSLTERK